MSLFNKGQILLIVGLVLEFPADSPVLESSGDPTELPAPPSTKHAGWIALQEKKKHDKANARKLTAAEASEREARQQEKQEKQVPRPIYQIPPPPAFRPPPRLSPPPPTTQPIPQPQKPRGRPKGTRKQSSYVLCCSTFFLRSASAYNIQIGPSDQRKEGLRERERSLAEEIPRAYVECYTPACYATQ